MWTPKRILLLVSGFLFFLCGYFIYAHFLGGIDGLPPLPERYRPDPNRRPEDFKIVYRENTAEALLRLAFGEECEEVKGRKFHLEVQPKGLVLAFNDFSIQDGGIKIEPCSIAIFGKEKNDGKARDINTVRSQRAFLRFEKPITSLHEIGKSKITRGEIAGDIYLINNRRTPERGDDISLFTQGPVYYQEARGQIWTMEPVLLTDPSSKPHPMTIRGTGMDVYLHAESKNPQQSKPTLASSKAANVSGVDVIELRSDVEMNLWVDSQSGFVGAGKPAEVKPGAVEEKTKLVINTQGKFRYDLSQDRASFHHAEVAGGKPNYVMVDRLDEVQGKLDHLQCEHLDLQFTRKSPIGAQAGGSSSERSEGLDLLTIMARGKEVILTSDAELLEAHGTEFSFDKRTRQSTLRGKPTMWALKEGNSIVAPELQLLDQKGAQHAVALGEGYFRMLDKTTGKWTIEAKWKKKLVFAREGTLDQLTLLGDATFVDPERNQQLQAQQLKVVLEPAPSTKGEQNKRRPKQLEAVGQVTALSPEMHVHDTERLLITFRPGAARPTVLPPPAGTKPAPEPAFLPPPTPVTGKASPTAQSTVISAANKKPINLSARLIEAKVLQLDSKNELEDVWCEGRVKVLQEPTNPKEKGVDIQGDTLKLTHQPEGNVLVVTGDNAQVQLNQVFILGPEVTIDQTSNEAWVNRMGIMRLPSEKGFDGVPLSRPSELTVSWERKMYFNGLEARFEGNVLARQDTGQLACQELSVNLDHRISLKDGDKGREPAKVQKLVCDKEVWIEDSTRDKDKVVSMRRIDCVLLSIDNYPESEESEVRAPGPGSVRMFEYGSKGDLFQPLPGNAQQPKSKQAEGAEAVEPKLTFVTYTGSMYGNNKKGLAKFFDGVVVIHVATADPDLKIDVDKPPPGSMRLGSNKLEVLSRKGKDGKAEQEMRAEGKVTVEGQGFWGRCDILKYDESKEQIILEGTDGNMAVLQKSTGRGRQRQEITASQILYNRKTGDFSAPRSRSIRFLQ